MIQFSFWAAFPFSSPFWWLFYSVLLFGGVSIQFSFLEAFPFRSPFWCLFHSVLLFGGVFHSVLLFGGFAVQFSFVGFLRIGLHIKVAE